MKVVLFDIDGTLINAGGAGSRALNRAVKLLHGADEVCSRFYLVGCTDKANFRQAFMKAAGRRPAKKEISEIERKYLEFLPGEVRSAVREKRYGKIPGVSGFLRILRGQKNILTGLGTGNLKKGAVIKLKPSGLEGYFLFGGFGGDSYSRTEVFKGAVKKASAISGAAISAGDVYMIGDTHNDVVAGKEAGYHTGIVTCGFGDKREIIRAGPEIIEKDFRDLSPWLIWLGLKKDPKGVKRDSYMFPDTPIEHVQYTLRGAPGASGPPEGGPRPASAITGIETKIEAVKRKRRAANRR